jgi:hypothetical protein
MGVNGSGCENPVAQGGRVKSSGKGGVSLIFSVLKWAAIIFFGLILLVIGLIIAREYWQRNRMISANTNMYVRKYKIQEYRKHSMDVVDEHGKKVGESYILFSDDPKSNDPKFYYKDQEQVSMDDNLSNTIVDFSGSGLDNYRIAKVVWGKDDSSPSYSASIQLDKKAPQALIDVDYIYFPGDLRVVDKGGPFATVHVKCTKDQIGIVGAEVQVDDKTAITDKDGLAKLDLTLIRDDYWKRVRSLKVTDPATHNSYYWKFAIPIVAARAGTLSYETLWVDLH